MTKENFRTFVLFFLLAALTVFIGAGLGLELSCK